MIIIAFYLILSVITHSVCALTPHTSFHVVVPSYNTQSWCIANLESIIQQEYPRELWHVTVIIDAATDDSPQLIQDYITEHDLSSLVKITTNVKNQGAMANIYQAVMDTPDDQVIVMVDGDDFLAHDQVLSYLDQVYQTQDVWLTYGSYREWPSGKPGFSPVYQSADSTNRTFRKTSYQAPPNHVKTFKAWLFKKIKKSDLMYDGKFLDVCSDVAMMFPMIEMCGDKFARIDDCLYLYNLHNPLSDFNIKLGWQLRVDQYLRSLRPYPPLRRNSSCAHY